MSTELDQIAYPGTESAPLLPVAHANPSSKPIIYFGEGTMMLRGLERVHPAV